MWDEPEKGKTTLHTTNDCNDPQWKCWCVTAKKEKKLTDHDFPFPLSGFCDFVCWAHLWVRHSTNDKYNQSRACVIFCCFIFVPLSKTCTAAKGGLNHLRQYFQNMVKKLAKDGSNIHYCVFLKYRISCIFSAFFKKTDYLTSTWTSHWFY